MNTRLLDYILDGSIVINSLEVFGLWIKRFPDHPNLLKIYANLMAANTHFQAAANHYDRAAQIFFEEGEFLQGVAAKMAQWQAIKPKKEEIEAFLDACQNIAPASNRAACFWKSLSPDELLDICQVVETKCYQAGITVKELGEVEKVLNFVVSGELKESNYRMIEDQRVKFKKPFQVLKADDIFGGIYPFSEDIRSQSHIVALKRTELIGISKEKLGRLCRVHPLLEAKIIDLIQIRAPKPSNKRSASARKARRYLLSTPISLEIIADKNGSEPIRLAGFSRDLSVSGLCFLAPASSIEDSHQRLLQGLLEDRSPEVRVTLAADKMSLTISSKLVRKERVMENGQIHLAFGIRFDDLPPLLGGSFFAFAQNMGTLTQNANAGFDPSELMN